MSQPGLDRSLFGFAGELMAARHGGQQRQQERGEDGERSQRHIHAVVSRQREEPARVSTGAMGQRKRDGEQDRHDEQST